MRRRHLRDRADLPLVAGLALLALVVCALAGDDLAGVVARTVVGLPLVLVLPGYALMAALLPAADWRGSRSQRDHAILERAVWSVGLSLAVSALGGLLLNLTPAGLVRLQWAALLCGITVAAAAVAWLRRPVGDPRPHRPRTGLGRRGAAWLAAAAALAVVALVLQPAAGPHARFTQLWLVTDRASAPPHDAKLGVRNNEHTEQRYRLVIRRDHRRAAVRTIGLAPGETWREHIPAPPRHLTQVLLYRPGDQASYPYRTVAIRPLHPAPAANQPVATAGGR
ncbi:MAG: DUF1616 domain-containing protein [Streptosporangiaceae bacterium]